MEHKHGLNKFVPYKKVKHRMEPQTGWGGRGSLETSWSNSCSERGQSGGNVSKDGDATASLGNLCQLCTGLLNVFCLLVYQGKKSFSISEMLYHFCGQEDVLGYRQKWHSDPMKYQSGKEAAWIY